MNANNTQVGGTHYLAAYQHWDLVADTGMGYFQGQITKYVIRHKKKHGLQDLHKARHFAQKYLEVFVSQAKPSFMYSSEVVESHLQQFFKDNPHVHGTERLIVEALTHRNRAGTCVVALHLINQLIESWEASEPGAGYVSQS